MPHGDLGTQRAAHLDALPPLGMDRVFASPADERAHRGHLARSNAWDTGSAMLSPLLGIIAGAATVTGAFQVDLPGVLAVAASCGGIASGMIVPAWWGTRRRNASLQCAHRIGWLVPTTAATAYRTVTEAPSALVELDAPGSAQDAVAAMLGPARECAEELDRLVHGRHTADQDWLRTTVAHQTLIQLAAQAQALVDLARDRHALITPQQASPAPLPSATSRAALEMREEIDAVRAALSGSPAPAATK